MMIPVILSCVVSLSTACGQGETGSFSVLAYNVAGLPMELSDVNPVEHMPLIGPHLNDFDLVLVQEDFWYHDQLSAGVTLPYRTEPMWESPDWDNFGDGLNGFSAFPFGSLVRIPWETCNGLINSGSDCMTNKGFSLARHTIAPGVVIDVYNLHMDASGSEEDIQARMAQAVQLATFIVENSKGAAVIVAGDTNLKQTRPADLETLDSFLAATGLSDSCRTLQCGDERIDRIMYRGSDGLNLRPIDWSLPAGFVDPDGQPLSDHEPVAVIFEWELDF